MTLKKALLIDTPAILPVSRSLLPFHGQSVPDLDLLERVYRFHQFRYRLPELESAFAGFWFCDVAHKNLAELALRRFFYNEALDSLIDVPFPALERGIFRQNLLAGHE